MRPSNLLDPSCGQEQKQTYTPVFPRWRHQDVALELMRKKAVFALFMQMRTGKTKTILDEFGECELRGSIKHLLVIAPAGVYRTWEVDAAKHLELDLQLRLQILRWESGPSLATKRVVDNFIQSDGPKILLMNIEALSIVPDAQELCVKFLKRAPSTMVIDESTCIKNLTAKRTRFCLAAGRLATRRRILSGLPSPQSPLDVYTQMEFLDSRIFGNQSLKEFTEQSAIVTHKPFRPGRRLVPVIDGYRNLDVMQAKMAPHSYRVLLADCTDLPPKLYVRRDIELTEVQAHLYNEMKKYATAMLGRTERVTATIVLTQLLRLHQILAGHTMSDNGEEVDIPENKTPEVLSLLEEHDGKAIVWAAYDADVRKLSTALESKFGVGTVARFWGQNTETRDQEEREFLTNPDCRFMVATAASGGRGRTWSVADMMIYYSNTFSLEHRLQSEERAQGIGKQINVVYVDLVAPDTIEVKILDTLKNKKKLSDAVTGDRWQEWLK